MAAQRNNQEFIQDNTDEWICIEGHKVHLIGLHSLFVEYFLADRNPTIEIACEMLEQMRINNDIPDGACETYAFAMLHAYERFLKNQKPQ